MNIKWRHLFEGKALSITPEMDAATKYITNYLLTTFIEDDSETYRKLYVKLDRKLKGIDIGRGVKVNIVLRITEDDTKTKPQKDVSASAHTKRNTTHNYKVLLNVGMSIGAPVAPWPPRIEKKIRQRITNTLLHEFIHLMDPKMHATFSHKEVKLDAAEIEAQGEDKTSSIEWQKAYIKLPTEAEAYMRLGARELVTDIYSLNEPKIGRARALRTIKTLISRPTMGRLDKAYPKRKRSFHVWYLVKTAGVYPKGSNQWKRLVNTLYDEFVKLERRV